ncbi:MAG: electron transfer flavoprotein subunit alpha/FixB family protein, partial [Bacteroidetes bacterium]|nr:electron transfer flavoprotein subunit alpha/FixB family protein [Bacteroidota bacterium]
MAVLVIVDHADGKITRSAYEAVFYARKVADQISTDCVALLAGELDDSIASSVGNYGAIKVLKVNDSRLNELDPQSYTKVVETAISTSNADVVVFSHNYTSKSVAPGLAANIKAALVVGVVDYPVIDGDKFVVKRSAFSGKGFAYVEMTSATKIIAIQSNSFRPEKGEATAEVETLSFDLADDDIGIKVKEVNKITGKISLSEASIVVSAGRGLKGPENWGMVEELAETLGAATACSRPVSDTGWRPHSEHVGQTGKTIRPNLYFAIGISGAIQHLAGVNGSKNIVVINTDPDAPFFKAADYGIV